MICRITANLGLINHIFKNNKIKVSKQIKYLHQKNQILSGITPQGQAYIVYYYFTKSMLFLLTLYDLGERISSVCPKF